jgi:2-polyprenyl-6-methoxyphenol hydroxylase-like FAD-dependent oxidoreductase
MDIGIVGAGISGLHLALRLQQSGVDTTVYAPRTADEQRAGRVANFVGRFGRTRDREHALGVSDGNKPDWELDAVRMTVGGPHPLGFAAMLRKPASAVDFRLYLPRLMDSYEQRGGRVHIGPVETADIRRLAAAHDLVVVASGGRSLAELFPRDASRSVHSGPQRRLCAGLYDGIAADPVPGVSFHISPGAGEILCYPFYSFAGRVHMLGIEAVPGGPLDHLTHLSHTDDPAAFRRALRDALAAHAPGLLDRVGTGFAPTRPLDVLRGAVTPVVRQGWAALDEDTYAIAVGDAWVVNDPLTGQGANLGSTCAFLLADAILAGPPFDERFCRTTVDTMWPAARAVTEWTTAFLAPPTEHLLGLLAAAADDVRVAHAFLNNFNDPVAMWDSIATPAHTATFVAGVQAEPLPRAG